MRALVDATFGTVEDQVVSILRPELPEDWKPEGQIDMGNVPWTAVEGVPADQTDIPRWASLWDWEDE